MVDLVAYSYPCTYSTFLDKTFAIQTQKLQVSGLKFQFIGLEC
jgi:hypothetical protein